MGCAWLPQAPPKRAGYTAHGMKISTKLSSNAYSISASSYQFRSIPFACKRRFKAHASITQLLMLHEKR